MDQRFDSNKCATGWKRVVGGADELHLFLQVPVVQNHSHYDHVRFRQRVPEEIACGSADPISQSGRGNMLFRYRLDRGQVESNALDMWMFLSHFDAEQPSCAPDIEQAAIAREIEFLGERFEVNTRQAGH